MEPRALKEQIFARTAELSGAPVESVRHDTSLESLGLDSADAVILAMEAEELLGQDVDVGIFLRFETLGEAVDHILARLADGRAPT